MADRIVEYYNRARSFQFKSQSRTIEYREKNNSEKKNNILAPRSKIFMLRNGNSKMLNVTQTTAKINLSRKFCCFAIFFIFLLFCLEIYYVRLTFALGHFLTQIHTTYCLQIMLVLFSVCMCFSSCLSFNFACICCNLTYRTVVWKSRVVTGRLKFVYFCFFYFSFIYLFCHSTKP